MSFLKAIAKFVLVQLISFLVFITIGIMKYSFSVFLDLMKYVIKQIIWYFAIFIKFLVFKIIKLIFRLVTAQKPKTNKHISALLRVPRAAGYCSNSKKSKQRYYLDVMTDDETDYETDYETDDD